MEVWNGPEGLEVYEQIHQNYWNQMIHFAFLPGVFYGAFRGIAALSQCRRPVSVIVGISSLYGFYYTYYCDIVSGAMTVLYISPYALLACLHLFNRKHHISESLIVLSISLVIQEVFGHTLLETTNSRLTFSYVLNAVMYSPLFYTKYVFIFPILYICQLLLTLSFFD